MRSTLGATLAMHFKHLRLAGHGLQRQSLWHVIMAINLCFSINLARSPPSARKVGCPPIPGLGKRFTFAREALLTVYLDTRFTSDQRTGIMKGFKSWLKENGTDGNASGITITKFEITPNPPRLAGPQNSVSVVAERPEGGLRGWSTSTLGPNGKKNSLIVIDPRVTSQYTMEEVAAHEVGHAVFGLDDCVGCSDSQTIMAGAPRCSCDAAVAQDPSCHGDADYNARRVLGQPSDCDQRRAKENGQYDNPAPPAPPTGRRGSAFNLPRTLRYLAVCYQWFQMKKVQGQSQEWRVVFPSP